MRYTSDPPFELPPGNGNDPTCEVLGVRVRVIPGVGEPEESTALDPIDRADEELADGDVDVPARFSPTPAA
jgi:hypothetical protein